MPPLAPVPRAATWLAKDARQAALSLLLVVILTALLAPVHFAVGVEHVTIVYVIPVLIAAIRWSILSAVIAAVAGVAVSAFFFYPPVFDLRVNDPDQIIDLALFVVVAVVTGKLAADVRQARSRAEAEVLRDALIGSVSHELRSPLSSIMGSASVLSEAPAIAADERLTSLVKGMREEADRLNDDIQNLLDATRITSEGIRPHVEWADPGDIANAAVARKRRFLAGRPIVLTVEPNLPFVEVDAGLIEKALAQLIDNAAKYSDRNSQIAVAVRSGASRITISVSDQGDGLMAEEQVRIFDRFYRSPRHAASTPGSGLGLWIARSLVQACGGSVAVRSAGVGRGTTVEIELPAQPQLLAEQDSDE